MYFLPADIDRLLTGVTRDQRDADIAQYLSDLAPRIIAERRDHRHFGPYWWWVKPLFATIPGARRGWIRGGYRDRAFLETFAAPESEDDARWTAWIGLRYFEAELVDDLPTEFHIVETPQHEVFAYQLYDADASQQMDPFDAPDEPSPEVRQLMRDPSRFSATSWLHRADELDARGEVWRAAAALRRAIERAVDDTDRSRAWLRLGQLFQEHHHVHKAIFCYRNAFEREQEGWVQGLMGEAWQDAGEPHEALRCYRKALDAMPGNPEYQAGVERAERAIRAEARNAAGYTLLQERLAR